MTEQENSVSLEHNDSKSNGSSLPENSNIHTDSNIKKDPITSEANEIATEISDNSQNTHNDDEHNNKTKNTDELVKEALKSRANIKFLIHNIRECKKSCDKLENENKYLQDYVGSLMASGKITNK